MAVTAYFILKEKGAHDGENLASTLEEVINEWDIRSGVSVIVTDNASSNDTCLRHLYNRLDPSMTESDKKACRLRYFGHILNLILKAFLLMLTDYCNKISKIFTTREKRGHSSDLHPNVLNALRRSHEKRLATTLKISCYPKRRYGKQRDKVEFYLSYNRTIGRDYDYSTAYMEDNAENIGLWLGWYLWSSVGGNRCNRVSLKPLRRLENVL
ncbi:hypothetical protein CI238_12065 [Colletotrichum incanum]|uniref:Transposase-like protein n=1 Tax=Colletotrichum incanum TaxID=1573173 RepID=A0A167CQZ3_COLIC|nr:hypothetical protein CI238_12065 [Colletotrichum incanum]